jgi:CO dehydrogenase maturation factor
MMGTVIAVAGKGGVGKTTMAALLVRLLAERGKGGVLAVDADPNSNLAYSLGITARQTIGDILDGVAQQPQELPAGMTKDRFIEYKVHTAIEEAEGFDVLTMGRPEGPGCYCYVNSVLRNCMDKLIAEYAYVIIDNEAGLEHLSRRTTRKADTLLIVSDQTKVALAAARRIAALADELKIEVKEKRLIINRCTGEGDAFSRESGDVPIAGTIPADEGIASLSLDGGSLLGLARNARAMTALARIGEKIWR